MGFTEYVAPFTRASMREPRGVGIHVGVNRVDAGHYGGWEGELIAGEADALAMQALAGAQGFRGTTLLTRAATAEALTAALTTAARQLDAGDGLLLTFSGCGGQVPDTGGDAGEGLDDTWALYDRAFVDDELYGLLGAFRPGVRILVVSDSCHCASVARATFYHDLLEHQPIRNVVSPHASRRFRAMPTEVQERTYRTHQALYDARQRRYAATDREAMDASVILLAACQDNQLSLDGPPHGLFTSMLLDVWNKGEFEGDFRHFHRAILARMPATQAPQYRRFGQRDVRFERARPFTI